MKQVFLYISVLFLIFSVSALYAQNSETDSLISVLKTQKIDTVRIQLYNQIAQKTAKENPQKALEFANKGLEISKKNNFLKGTADLYKTIGIIYFYSGENEKAFTNFFLSLETYKTMGDLNGVARSYNNIGVIYKNTGKLDKAIENYEKCREILEKIQDKKGLAAVYNNIGNVYTTQGNNIQAIENLLKSLEIYEDIKDKDGAGQANINIGNIQRSQNNLDEALIYYGKADVLLKQTDDQKGLADIYNNIGAVYHDKKNYEKALIFYEKCLKISESLDYKNKVALSFYNIGDTYMKNKKFGEALSYFNKSLKIYTELEDILGIVNCNNGIGEYYFQIGNYKSATEKMEFAKKTAHSQNLVEAEKEAAEWLSKSYEKLGNYKKAYDNHLLFKMLNDSIFNQNNTRSIAILETKAEYEKQKKIKELEQQKQTELQDAKLKKQKIITTFFIIGFLLMILLAVVIYRSYRNKQKANKLLADQKQEIEYKNVELEQQKEEITAQRDEIESQSVVIIGQRDVALRQKKEITDSIQYAKRIQNAILPTRKMFTDDLEDYFILFQPRDIVSGDFYWMAKQNEKLIITAADCTGHGVPGAFMSMLGVSFLNEIVNKGQLSESHLILDKLRENVIESLHQTGKDDEAKDGMDIALCVFDTNKNELQFSGAYNPLYIVRKQSETPEIIEVKPDRMPIGIYMSTMKPYTQKIIPIQKGDTFYIFSDGYIDQFGGQKGLKLKSRNFKEILLEIQHLSMQEQKHYLENYMKNWRDSRNQIDDILIIGIRY